MYLDAAAPLFPLDTTPVVRPTLPPCRAWLFASFPNRSRPQKA